MATRVYLNNVKTRLTATLAAAGLTANVTAGDGAQFAGATGGNWIIATLVKVSGYREIAWEIVKITARSTDALTIVRAQEGTVALDFAVGDVLDVRATKNSFTELAGDVTVPGALSVTGAISVGVQGRIENTVALQMGVLSNAYFDGTNWRYLTANFATGVRQLANSGVIDFHSAASGAAGAIITNWDTTDKKMSIAQSGAVTIHDTLVLAATATPTGAGGGAVGQIAWDTSYLYVCTAVNDWRRIALVDF